MFLPIMNTMIMAFATRLEALEELIPATLMSQEDLPPQQTQILPIEYTPIDYVDSEPTSDFEYSEDEYE